MGPDQIVAETSYPVKGQFRCRVGVEHGGLVDSVFPLRNRSIYGQQLYADIGIVQGRQLIWKIPDIAAANPAAIHHAGDFYTGIGRQVGDKAGVDDIPPDSVRFIRLDGFHNV